MNYQHRLDMTQQVFLGQREPLEGLDLERRPPVGIGFCVVAVDIEAIPAAVVRKLLRMFFDGCSIAVPGNVTAGLTLNHTLQLKLAFVDWST